MVDLRNKTRDQLIRELEKALKKINAFSPGDGDDQKVIEALERSKQRFRNIVRSSPMEIHMYRLETGDCLVFQGENPAAVLSRSLLMWNDCPGN